jgi:hypothetical protein
VAIVRSMRIAIDVLGDRPIKDTDVIGILSNGFTLSRLVVQTLARINRKIAF